MLPIGSTLMSPETLVEDSATARFAVGEVAVAEEESATRGETDVAVGPDTYTDM